MSGSLTFLVGTVNYLGQSVPLITKATAGHLLVAPPHVRHP